jgi:hypothetical protein
MITLELTLAETNLVLEALGTLPYARVYELINKIHQQAEDAVEEASRDRQPSAALASGRADPGKPGA